MATTNWTQTAGMVSEEDTDNLESYADQAEASKDAAAASETAAAASESNASASAAAAASSASTATTQATSAAASATAASTSATNAATSATAASGSATAASTSAANAATSESNASASEANAATSESNASTSESNAAASATSASTSAATATTQATAAATSATNAATSETNAGTSETNAATSATNASTSESNAATSATTATTQATAAATSATNASTSETNAATSATNASTSETNAATSETNAATSEANAATSATSASTSASTATTQATAAATSATNAATSATNASTSETNAATSATNASTSETNAANSATTASTQATNAATSATNAATSASNASTSETNASTSATNAASSAASAASSYDDFDDRYLGAKASAPTLDNDGDPLITGALYFNTVTDEMKVYDGSAWLNAYASLSGVLFESGGTMTGNLILNADPTSALQAATKEYVDTIAAAGLHYHDPVRVEKEGNLNATYNNGTNGVGATLTNAGTQEALVIDGVTMVSGDRVLVYEQSDATQNGVYTVTDIGSASTNWVLTRSTDTDTAAPSDPDAFGKGDAFFVMEGNEGAGELYVMNTAGTITFGTTDITFTQVASTAVYTAGTGITLNGTQFNIGQAVGTSDSPTFAAISVTGNVDGRNVSADGTKLDTIETNADVTDAANVTAAGALMDSEVTNLAQVKAFDSADYATAAQGTLADSALQTGDNVSALTNDAGYTTNVGDITGVTAGSGITGGGVSGTVTISHADTSSQASINGSGRTYIQDITLDTYGHVTGLSTATETVVNTDTTYSAGTALDLSGTTFNVDLSELSTSTTNGDGDYFVVTDTSNAQRKLTKGNINISGFNNDAGYTTNTGDITGVTAGTGLSGGGSSGSVTLNVDVGTTASKIVQLDGSARLPAVDGSQLTGVGGGVPSGTKMLFQQTSAPTGWTKDTTHNNKALRVVSGTAGSGGNSSFTTIFADRTSSSTAAGGTVGSRTLSTSQMPSHRHHSGYSGVNATASYGVSSAPSVGNINGQNGISTINKDNTNSVGSGSSHDHSFSGSSHSHTLDMRVQYVDLIIATKD